MKLLAYILAGIVVTPVAMVAILFMLFWPLWLFDNFLLAFAWPVVALGSFCGYMAYLETEGE